ncbi:MAG: NapC/NirT family cytochrome c [Acidobacteriota bacterium]
MLTRTAKTAGISLAGLGLIGGIVFAVAVMTTDQPGPFTSIAAWFILPLVFYCGLILLAIGFIGDHLRRRQSRNNRPSNRFQIDFTPPRMRRLLYWGAPLCLLTLFATVLCAYQAYEFTESTVFCASVCHAVMEPERVTHVISPHAEVSCSTCHVGHTAAQYIEAKLFGIEELYHLLRNDFPRPIPTPIQRMEPVRENCTGCHWDQNYWGKVHREYSHYITANDNQLWNLQMNVKVGGMYRLSGEGEGIHWHMKLGPQVFYIATDERLDTIPWVKLISEQGEETIYQSTEEPLAEEAWDSFEVREMTCVDCHNRPAHQFKAPILAIDDAIAREWMSPSLPEVKAQGVKLLADQSYLTKEEAVVTIRSRFYDFYRENHPEILESRRGDVDRAAETLGRIYRQNFFPEMKADWRSYSDNIGHFLSDGCFRCHDGLHVDEQGNTISDDCSLCHDIVVQGPEDEIESDAAGLSFRHPVDFGLPIRELGKCADCHDGSLGQ